MNTINNEMQERIMEAISYGGYNVQTLDHSGKDFNNYGYKTPAPPGPFSAGSAGSDGDWHDLNLEVGIDKTGPNAGMSGSLSDWGDGWDSFTDTVSDGWDSFTDTVGGFFD